MRSCWMERLLVKLSVIASNLHLLRSTIYKLGSRDSLTLRWREEIAFDNVMTSLHISHILLKLVVFETEFICICILLQLLTSVICRWREVCVRKLSVKNKSIILGHLCFCFWRINTSYTWVKIWILLSHCARKNSNLKTKVFCALIKRGLSLIGADPSGITFLTLLKISARVKGRIRLSA